MMALDREDVIGYLRSEKSWCGQGSLRTSLTSRKVRQRLAGLVRTAGYPHYEFTRPHDLHRYQRPKGLMWTPDCRITGDQPRCHRGVKTNGNSSSLGWRQWCPCVAGVLWRARRAGRTTHGSWLADPLSSVTASAASRQWAVPPRTRRRDTCRSAGSDQPIESAMHPRQTAARLLAETTILSTLRGHDDDFHDRMAAVRDIHPLSSSIIEDLALRVMSINPNLALHQAGLL
jgi:hypothetical protein